MSARLASDICTWGAYCGHATLTVRIGVYRCPFGECFKRVEAERKAKAAEKKK